MRGYVNCACRDCFEIAISSDDQPALCHECEEAGCETFPSDADPEAREVELPPDEDGKRVKVPSSFYACAVERCPDCECEVSQCSCEADAESEADNV